MYVRIHTYKETLKKDSIIRTVPSFTNYIYEVNGIKNSWNEILILILSSKFLNT